LLLLFIFVLAIFLGLELINKVPSQLHTPLMSGSNAISGITIVGAMAATAVGGPLGTALAVLAIVLATINVVGGYLVTDRILGMFKAGRKPERRAGAELPRTLLRSRCRTFHSQSEDARPRRHCQARQPHLGR